MTAFNIVDTSVSVMYSYFFAWRLFRDKGWKVFVKQTVLSVSYILVVLILVILDR